jgi:NAD(P)-dependent dehydrogenase (short-subunit alcohol dehydrogenase family)|tara:strand:+ start:1011 stop:1685 length:675 start_codon:yes stop_codon:yes gene_type:complete
MNKIIITGSEGLIGKKVSNFFSKKSGFKIVKLDKKLGHNLISEAEVSKIFRKNKNANYLINLHGLDDRVKKNKSKSQNLKDDFLNYHLNNVFSVYLTNIKFIKNCKLAKGIVNFASLYAIMSPKHYLYKRPKNIFYVTSKFSIVGLTKYFASKYGKKINVNCIINSGIEADQPKKFKRSLAFHTPKKRMMKIEDLYGMLELLTSKRSNYINGSSIVIDGGYSAW